MANPALKDIAPLVRPTPPPIYRYPALQPRQQLTLPCNNACSNIYAAATLCAADTCLCPTILSQGVACSSCLVPVDPAIASSFGAIITLCSSELAAASGVTFSASAVSGTGTYSAVTGNGFTINVPVPTTTAQNAPITVGPSATATSTSTSTGEGGHGFPPGAIGGIVGGVCALLLIGGALVFWWKRQKRRNAPIPGTIESIQPEPKPQTAWEGPTTSSGGGEIPSGRLRYPDEDLPALGESAPIGARTSQHY